jgi:hypothetical protein
VDSIRRCLPDRSSDFFPSSTARLSLLATNFSQPSISSFDAPRMRSGHCTMTAPMSRLNTSSLVPAVMVRCRVVRLSDAVAKARKSESDAGAGPKTRHPSLARRPFFSHLEKQKRPVGACNTGEATITRRFRQITALYLDSSGCVPSREVPLWQMFCPASASSPATSGASKSYSRRLCRLRLRLNWQQIATMKKPPAANWRLSELSREGPCVLVNARYEPGRGPRELDAMTTNQAMLDLQQKLLSLQENVFTWRQQQAEKDEKLTLQIEALGQVHHNETLDVSKSNARGANWQAIGTIAACVLAVASMLLSWFSQSR